MKRFLLAGVGLVLVMGGIVGGRALLRRLAFFDIRRIELTGARYLTAAEVARAMQIPVGTSLFDPIGPWERRVEELPGVIEARVGRRLPGTLRVRVIEAEPVALAERGPRLVLVDQAGKILPFDPSRPATDLPLAAADSQVTGVLARVREADPDLFGRIERGGRLARGEVALEFGTGRLLVRADAGPEAFEALSLVADLLAREGKPWRELDARFLPRIIVRPGSART
ncbi:MAG: cell division protein FtsQ/DivIB [Gemmatimonadales bacterium]